MNTSTAAVAGVLLSAATSFALAPEVVHSARAVPPHVAGRFREPVDFQQAATGQRFVFDRRDHTVYALDDDLSSAWPVVHIGAEPGRIIRPSAFSVAPDGSFVVADAPEDRDRIQIFSPVGVRIGGFLLAGPTRPRITLNSAVLSGIGSLQYTGATVLLSLPETGALVTEYATSGRASRMFGALRSTGREHDHDVHLAMNSGFPLIDPGGGFYYVFQAGTPAFRRYDADGRLVFERHMQGQEIDPLVREAPTTWTRPDGDLPLVPPTVRSAAVDAESRLWVAFSVPYVYVYDRDGDKVRAIQLRGAGVITATSLAFGPGGRLLVAPGLYEFDVRPREAEVARLRAGPARP